LLAFISVYFFESRLFNGLRLIQIKKLLLRSGSRGRLWAKVSNSHSSSSSRPSTGDKDILSIGIDSGYFRFCQNNSRLPCVNSLDQEQAERSGLARPSARQRSECKRISVPNAMGFAPLHGFSIEKLGCLLVRGPRTLGVLDMDIPPACGVVRGVKKRDQDCRSRTKADEQRVSLRVRNAQIAAVRSGVAKGANRTRSGRSWLVRGFETNAFHERAFMKQAANASLRAVSMWARAAEGTARSRAGAPH
jgi:hypothetical protein